MTKTTINYKTRGEDESSLEIEGELESLAHNGEELLARVTEMAQVLDQLKRNRVNWKTLFGALIVGAAVSIILASWTIHRLRHLPADREEIRALLAHHYSTPKFSIGDLVECNLGKRWMVRNVFKHQQPRDGSIRWSYKLQTATLSPVTVGEAWATRPERSLRGILDERYPKSGRVKRVEPMPPLP
tara:strand:+ start:9072 stop:9629 length:558 start_codon:yes stop_codon:yes gene_type:complete